MVDQDTFSSNILGRYFCNTLDEAVESEKSKPFDVVVVGSGMYGSYIASKLYYWSKKQFGEDKGLKVLVLEAGPYIVHEHIENLPPNTDGIFNEVNKSPYICHVKRQMKELDYFGEVTKHSYCVGGKSLTWGKWSPRLTKKDLESWPQEVMKYLLYREKDKNGEYENDNYSNVEQEIGVKPFSDLIFGRLFQSTKILIKKGLDSLNHLELWDPPVAVNTESTLSGLYSPGAFSSLGRLLQNVRTESSSPENLVKKAIFLVPNTLAYQLKIDRGRVCGINVVHGASKEKKYFELSEQCDVILAATAIESTRLVLNSFPKSTDSAKELIGRNLVGHLFSSVSVRIKQETFKGLFNRNNFGDLFEKAIRNFLSKIKVDLKKEEKLDRYGLFKREVLDDLFDKAIEGFNKRDSRQPGTLHHIQGYSERFKRSYHFQLFCSSGSDNVFENLYKMFYDSRRLIEASKSQQSGWINILVLSCAEVQGKTKASLYTEGSNWMDLSKDQWEEFGEVKYAKPYLKWESSQEDEEFWDEVLSTLFEFLSSLVPFGDIEYQDPNDVKNWTKEKPTTFDSYQKTEAFWNSRHESGTMWMGENADESVTDLDGKLHHVQNVYCADQAIFPTVGSANPVLTGLTLDRKIAQAIIDRYKNFPGDFSESKYFEENDLFNYSDPKINGFQPLFDGTSFDGWGIQNKGKYLILSDWKILELEPKTNLGVAWYKMETFSEFELIVDWKVFGYDSNSGIVIHAPDPAQLPEDKDAPIYEGGYEIQIDESGYNFIKDKKINGNPSHRQEFYGSPSHKTGAIYNLAPANRGNAKKPGFWNRFIIVSSKSELKVYLNGKLVSHLPSLLEDRNKSGYICLQFHTKKVQFRNILIKELSST